ncbi:cytochrome b pre-mRNA-processing protein 3 [Sphingobium subterraneum]|uniref:Cytochrome b pre-mRNA-processing protein 3 n=2 Tax=Sphingobium subterraneum TaxID=627688 RepID=A0A841J340_9SPHN|nr:cytochrome b pre-mRNA-processing protein 3 [Sphingobium subterraneum]
MSIFDRLFRRPEDRTVMRPLYDAVVARGRDVRWYVEGAVPDTLDGRFDMIAAILSLVLCRLDHADMRHENVWLTELFVDDMDSQLRQMGIGDVVVGKHIGRMMSALGGRLSAYRAGIAPGGDLADALKRNLYRGEPVDPAAVAFVEKGLRAFSAALQATTPDSLIAGKLPE